MHAARLVVERKEAFLVPVDLHDTADETCSLTQDATANGSDACVALSVARRNLTPTGRSGEFLNAVGSLARSMR